MAERQKRGPKKGALYKNNSELRLDLIQTLKSKGFDPAAALVETYLDARKMFKERTKKSASGFGGATYLQISGQAANNLAEFVYPKPKSVELTGKDGEHLFQSLSDLFKQVVDDQEKK